MPHVNSGFVNDGDSGSSSPDKGKKSKRQNQIGNFSESSEDQIRSHSATTVKQFDYSSSSGVGSEGGDDALSDTISKIPYDEGSKRHLAILGSGDFGRALAGRMVQAGYSVNIGSRDPTRNKKLVEKLGASSMTQHEAIHSSDVIIVAVPKDYYMDLPTDIMDGKILVDVSNRTSVSRKHTMSQAEHLQKMVPNAIVVKSFNVLSAYALESGGIQGSKEVFVASDDELAKLEVMNIVRSGGFTPVDMGGLRSARDIEDIPVQRFENWKAPFLVSILIFAFLYLLSFLKFQVCWTLTWGDGTWHWNRWHFLPMDTLNKTLAPHALTMLATCYLPGILAAYIQIIRGTKYSRFPKWLDNWLKMRKQLGLLMLLSASLHACFSVAIMSPEYHDLVYGYPKNIQADVVQGSGNDTQVQEDVPVKIYGRKMEWRGEMFLTCGVLSFALTVILGITSLPSVTANLTWKEFAFVQSKLGWICLILASAHNLFYGWPYINSPSCYIPSGFQYVMYLPGLTILLKIPLIFLSGYINKIRGGWERGKGQRYKQEVMKA